MMTTLWHFFFGKNVTLQYPEERLELRPGREAARA